MSLRFVWQNLLVLDGFWMPALIVNWSGAQVDPEATGSPLVSCRESLLAAERLRPAGCRVCGRFVRAA